MPDGFFSCDDHLDLPYVPADVWQRRLPVELREKGPRVVERDGDRWWWWEGAARSAYGRKPGLIDSFARAGLPAEPEPGVFRPSSPALRLSDMDADGVDVSVVFLPGTATGRLGSIDDPALRLACVQVLNDWAVEEFASAAPDRLIPVAELPSDDPAAAVAEAYRVRDLGYRAAATSASVTPAIVDDAWEPLWQALEDTGLVLNIHLGGRTHTLDMTAGDWQMAPFTSVIHMQMDEVLAGLVFAGVLERHPRLTVVLAECGVGWVPYLLDMMDFMQDEWLPLKGDRGLTMKASDYFRRQMYVTFEQERVGPTLIPLLGADRVMWASDYPHGISTFPHSREKVASMFSTLDEADRWKVVRDNAASVYRAAAGVGAAPA
jgi:uncharacterized protein